MDNLISLYTQRLNLENALFSRIAHENATVAIVYKITKSDGVALILKVCTRTNDYFHEKYFLEYFADKLPVPIIRDLVPPEDGIHGAILMEYLPGKLVTSSNFTDTVAFEIGSLLGLIHLHRTSGYGDLLQPHDLSTDPRAYFTLKFQEGLAECRNHLPESLIEKCRNYYQSHLNLFEVVDGPCITHRDFRAGNVLVNDGKVQGIIDWSAARASFAQEDFCFLEHGDWPINAVSKSSFLKGYASIRPIPAFTEIMPLLRMSRAIAIIGFAFKRGTWKTTMADTYNYNLQFLESFFYK